MSREEQHEEGGMTKCNINGGNRRRREPARPIVRFGGDKCKQRITRHKCLSHSKLTILTTAIILISKAANNNNKGDKLILNQFGKLKIRREKQLECMRNN